MVKGRRDEGADDATVQHGKGEGNTTVRDM